MPDLCNLCFQFMLMNEQLLSKIKIVALAVIAASLAVIAFKQLQPSYVETDKGIYLDTHSGKFYRKQGNELVPANESFEDKMRREYPDARKY